MVAVPNLAGVVEIQILVVVDEKFPGRTVLVLSELLNTGETNWVPRVPRIPEDSSKGVDCRGRVVAFGSARIGYGLASRLELLQGMMTS